MKKIVLITLIMVVGTGNVGLFVAKSPVKNTKQTKQTDKLKTLKRQIQGLMRKLDIKRRTLANPAKVLSDNQIKKRKKEINELDKQLAKLLKQQTKLKESLNK